jgi:GTP-binding protein EngB required for normal cell division
MELNAIDVRHFSALTRLAFTPLPHGRPPAWLQAQFELCVKHYQSAPITPQFRAALHRFQSQQEEAFELFVVGEGNFGKSTLVNALVGHKISAVDFRPETRSFLKYVLSSKPVITATIDAQLAVGIHDEMRDLLGEEKDSPIYGARRYTLDRDRADSALAADSNACRERGRDYTPAIVEIEREIPWTPESLFPEGVKLVDTQGLNQIFDDDVLKRCAEMDTFNSEKEFDRWMSESRRGRHLDWQFRRCDAVLWLISAQRPSSGATRAALRYLSKYGKRTVIAVTQIDRVQGGADQLDRVLAEIRSQFGEFASEVIPVNARLAMESSLSRNKEGIRDSGLAELVTRLRTVCMEDAGRVRACSQYSSLRTTEAQMRMAIGTMITEVETIRQRLARLRRQVEEARVAGEENIRNALRNSGNRELRELKARTDAIGLMDDTNSALNILQPGVAHTNFENSSQSARIALEGEIDALIGVLKTEPFALPAFDAEGRKDGSVVCAIFAAEMAKIEVPSLRLSFYLTDRPIKALKIWALKKVKWTREDAEKEERTLNRERRGRIISELEEKWGVLQTETIGRITEQSGKVFLGLAQGLDRIEAEIETVDKRPLGETSRRLKETVSARCVNSPYVMTVLTAMRGAIDRARTRLSGGG